MTKITLITEQAALAKAIDANAKSAKKVDEQWHVLALSAVAVFEQHGNVFYINKVFKSLGKGARHAAMTGWLLAFGGVKANTGENKAETPFIKDATKKVDLAEGEKAPWFQFAPSKKPDEVVDYYALLMKVVNRSPKEGQTVKGGELRAKVAELLREAGMDVPDAEPTDGEKADDALEGVGEALM